MSNSNFIKELLDILDLNLTFSDSCFSQELIEGEICNVFEGTLTYKPEHCLHCHHENNQSIIKWGWKKVAILLNDVSNYKTILRINKQRFKCNACHRTFLAEDTVSDRHCFIARRVTLAILNLLTEPLSMALIARLKHVSPATVTRALRSFETKKVCATATLPEVLCVDEFKSVKQVAGAMSFVMMDGKTHQLLDIVDNRQLSNLRQYFWRYPIEARATVRLVVTDFYSPYRTLVKELFPNAQIVADRFHISQHIGRAFTQHRIQVMKTFKKSHYMYKHLKRYWKLLQKNAWDLDYEIRHWRPSFKAYLTETEIVDRLLSYDPGLSQGYDIYQRFLSAMKRRNVPCFIQLLNEDYSELPDYYRTVITTFRKYKKEIKRALRVPYSNGPLECLNNHIKVLKRIAYGFRNFYNFRERIFLYRGNYFKKLQPTTNKRLDNKAA